MCNGRRGRAGGEAGRGGPMLHCGRAGGSSSGLFEWSWPRDRWQWTCVPAESGAGALLIDTTMPRATQGDTLRGDAPGHRRGWRHGDRQEGGLACAGPLRLTPGLPQPRKPLNVGDRVPHRSRAHRGQHRDRSRGLAVGAHSVPPFCEPRIISRAMPVKDASVLSLTSPSEALGLP